MPESGPRNVRVFQGTMILFVLSELVGFILHSTRRRARDKRCLFGNQHTSLPERLLS